MMLGWLLPITKPIQRHRLAPLMLTQHGQRFIMVINIIIHITIITIIIILVTVITIIMTIISFTTVIMILIIYSRNWELFLVIFGRLESSWAINDHQHHHESSSK